MFEPKAQENSEVSSAETAEAPSEIYVGTAAWQIPKTAAEHFPTEGSHLKKYSAMLNAVEINSSFYRDHLPKSYARWAAEVPPDFRFSVKLSKYFTHENKLKESGRLAEVIEPILELGPKLSILLVQLPPSLGFVKSQAWDFFCALRTHYSGDIALEARHETWVSAEAISLLKEARLSPVIADPPRLKLTHELTENTGLRYFRLHGSPEIYKSNYEPRTLHWYASQILSLHQKKLRTWCIFDNTTFGHATLNALSLNKTINQMLAQMRRGSMTEALRESSDRHWLDKAQ